MNHTAIISLAGIGLMASVCQWLAWRVKLPAILFLLLTGILAGPVTGWLQPDLLFGDLLFPMVSLSVALILFEGSLTLKLEEIRGVGEVVRKLLTTGLLITWLVGTLATHWLLGFSLSLSFLFGAVIVVTGPTVIVPMLRTVRPNARIANILRWEGIIIDPFGALLAVLVFEFIVSSTTTGGGLGHVIGIFSLTLITGTVIGACCGYLFGLLLRHHMLPEYLHNVATLSLVLAVYAFSNTIAEESGLLAVTITGAWLGNMRQVDTEDILNFKESLSVLLISGLFIILAARVEFSQIITLGWGALGVLLAIQFIARPLKVFTSTLGSSLNWRERALIGWIAPRGIVAAAISALFAIRLETLGFEQAPLIVPLTFIIIIGTVVLQSATARPLAHLLKVAEPATKGLLIIGANKVARAIAKALREQGFDTILVDTYWENIREARMEGLRTFYGNPVSDHADRQLELVGIGRMLGLSPHKELNLLSILRYQREFGKNAVYRLSVAADDNKASKTSVTTQQGGRVLFDDEMTYPKLAGLVSRGAEIRATTLGDEFSFEDYREKHGRNAIPLFALNTKGELRIFVADDKLKPASGWTIMSIIRPREGKSEKSITKPSNGKPADKSSASKSLP